MFPLPDRAAVDHLAMQIGTRRIEGEIRERAQARATYEQAKTDGRKATLVEQERPNVFTTSVAHIGPGEEIGVSIEYQETLVYDAGSFRLRFPLVVAPRYTPGLIAMAGEAGTGWGVNTDQVPDAARVTPPVARPDEGFINPVEIAVELHSGFALSAHLQRVPRHRRRRIGRSSLFGPARRWTRARESRLRARLDARCRRRSRCGRFCGAQGR